MFVCGDVGELGARLDLHNRSWTAPALTERCTDATVSAHDGAWAPRLQMPPSERPGRSVTGAARARRRVRRSLTQFEILSNSGEVEATSSPMN